MVVADNPVNFESIHCCGFLHRVKPGFPPMKDVSLEYLIARYNGESYYGDEETRERTDRSTIKHRKRAICGLTNVILYSVLFVEIGFATKVEFDFS